MRMRMRILSTSIYNHVNTTYHKDILEAKRKTTEEVNEEVNEDEDENVEIEEENKYYVTCECGSRVLPMSMYNHKKTITHQIKMKTINQRKKKMQKEIEIATQELESEEVDYKEKYLKLKIKYRGIVKKYETIKKLI